MLQHGAWKGRQIVSSAWIEQSMIPRTSCKGLMFGGPEGISSYGYLWWLGRTVNNSEHDLIAAAGNGGQRLFIVPGLDLVIATTAGVYGGKSSGLTGARALNQFVLPAVAH
jgi:CubicO group peptidase (beta-lactamase class C family)